MKIHERFFLWTPHPYVFWSWRVATKRLEMFLAIFLESVGSKMANIFFSPNLEVMGMDVFIDCQSLWLIFSSSMSNWHLFQVRLRASNLGIVECSPSILLDCKPGLRARSIVTDHLKRLCFQSIIGSTLFLARVPNYEDIFVSPFKRVSGSPRRLGRCRRWAMVSLDLDVLGRAQQWPLAPWILGCLGLEKTWGMDGGLKIVLICWV